MEIVVLRLGHRRARDKRATTHVGLTARALGADRIIITGDKDETLLKSIRRVAGRWGGEFEVAMQDSWKPVVKAFKEEGYEIIHLTMYGLPFQTKLEEIRKSPKNKLLIVGGEKVPGEVYQAADYNLAVTSQPHSEIAALAVFLDSFFEGKELEREFPRAKIKVVPQERRKQVLECGKDSCKPNPKRF